MRADATSANQIFLTLPGKDGGEAVLRIGQVIREWERIRTAADKQGFKLDQPPVALTMIGVAVEPPKDWSKVKIGGDASKAEIDAGDEDLDAFDTAFTLRKEGGTWRWDAAEAVEADTARGSAELVRYLKVLQGSLDAVQRQLETKSIKPSADLALTIDRAVCASFLGKHFAAAVPPAAPAALAPGETRRLAQQGGRITAMALTADGKQLLIGKASSIAPLEILRTDGDATQKPTPVELPDAVAADVLAMEASHDGRFIAVLADQYYARSVLSAYRDSEPDRPQEWLNPARILSVVDTTNWSIRSVAVPGQVEEMLAIAPDGSSIGLAGLVNSEIIELPLPQRLPRSPRGTELPRAHSVNFTSDGMKLVVCGINGDVSILNLTSRATERKFRFQVQERERLLETSRLSPDGSLLAAGTTAGVILVDMTGGARKTLLALPRSERGISRVNSIEFSGDGAKVLGASGLLSLDRGAPQGLSALIRMNNAFSVCLWDTASGELIKELSGHTQTVTAAAFFNDEKEIISCSTDGTVRKWSLKTP
jgi:hypothetical protein